MFFDDRSSAPGGALKLGVLGIHYGPRIAAREDRCNGRELSDDSLPENENLWRYSVRKKIFKKVLDRNFASGYFVDTSVITARSLGRPH